jgi:ribonucleoside-diphosphate reductase alpha chain
MGEEMKNSGMQIERYFSRDGDPYATTAWDKTDVTITNDQGEPLYTQKGVEFPKRWGDLARKIVASKYFYGENGTPQRENSIKQLINRVTGTITSWGEKQNYFKSTEDAKAFNEELAALTINQKMAFNSPVWFNVGVDRYLANTTRKTEQKNHFIYDKVSNAIIPLPIGSEYEHPQTSACSIPLLNLPFSSFFLNTSTYRRNIQELTL